MKSAKQNTIQQSIDRHRITLIESKLFTSTKQRTLHADDGYKKNGPRKASGFVDVKQHKTQRHRLLIDPVSIHKR